MTKNHVLGQLQGLDGPMNVRLEKLVALLEGAARAASSQQHGPSRWQLQEARALQAWIADNVRSHCPPSIRPDNADVLCAAATQGPTALQRVRQELSARLALLADVKTRLEDSRLRQRSLELRLACVEHVEAIFTVQRAQP